MRGGMPARAPCFAERLSSCSSNTANVMLQDVSCGRKGSQYASTTCRLVHCVNCSAYLSQR